MKERVRLFVLILRLLFQFFSVDFDWWDWDEPMVSAILGFKEEFQYNMVRGSGSSSSNPRWELDLNQHPLEDVEIPAAEEHVDPIQRILNKRLLEKENEIRAIVESMVREEVQKRGLEISHFDLRKLDLLVSQVIGEHVQRFDRKDAKQKLRAYSCLVTKLGKDTHGIAYQVKTRIERNLFDFIVQE